MCADLPGCNLDVDAAARLYRNVYTDNKYKTGGRERGAVGMRLVRL